MPSKLLKFLIKLASENQVFSISEHFQKIRDFHCFLKYFLKKNRALPGAQPPEPPISAYC